MYKNQVQLLKGYLFVKTRYHTMYIHQRPPDSGDPFVTAINESK